MIYKKVLKLLYISQTCWKTCISIFLDILSVFTFYNYLIQICFYVQKAKCPTCDACAAATIHGSAGLSAALSHHAQVVICIVTKVGHSIITTGLCLSVDVVIVYSDVEATVLAFGTGPGQDDFCVWFVWTFTLQVFHWACICGMKKNNQEKMNKTFFFFFFLICLNSFLGHLKLASTDQNIFTIFLPITEETGSSCH